MNTVWITEAVHATPFGPAPSVVVAYPSFEDWMRLYKPLKSRTEQWKREMYADFKRRHERTTAAELQTIGRSLTGAAVLSEINGRPTYSVMIFPFDFLPENSWSIDTGAVTRPTDVLTEWSVGVPMYGVSSTGKRSLAASKPNVFRLATALLPKLRLAARSLSTSKSITITTVYTVR
jgi:hypothetical protein